MASAGIKNEAAWYPENKAQFKVGPAPAPTAGENEVIIKVAYAAVNPVDWKVQDGSFPLQSFPSVLGTDVAGTISSVGSAATFFKPGQRVMAHCDSLVTSARGGGFQRYVAVREMLTCAVPDSLPLANASVLPLAVDTAATALFKHLGLPYPEMSPKKDGRTVLVWGGSSSVGSCAIQLAIASGLTVATTASAHNESYVKSLGATHFFDYNDANVIPAILKLLKPGDLVFDSISTAEVQKACAEIVSKLGGEKKLPIVLPKEKTGFEDVEVVGVFGMDPGLQNHKLAAALWQHYIPTALAAGRFQAKPDPMVLEGSGLGRVQEGLDMLRKGVSAKKVVIEVEKA